jgi:hypothetical protein
MDAAAARLAEIGRPDGLIATTDADSVPAADWLERQIAHVRAGAQVIAGMIELDVADASGLPDSVLVRRRADAAQRMAAVLGQDDRAAHHHFAGASLGITVDTYRAVGAWRRRPRSRTKYSPSG